MNKQNSKIPMLFLILSTFILCVHYLIPFSYFFPENKYSFEIPFLESLIGLTFLCFPPFVWGILMGINILKVVWQKQILFSFIGILFLLFIQNVAHWLLVNPVWITGEVRASILVFIYSFFPGWLLGITFVFLKWFFRFLRRKYKPI